MAVERFEFTGGQGVTLAGRLERPEGTLRAAALFAHCFTCGKDVRAAARIARRLSEAGYAVLRFDFTGLGDSEGEFANGGFASDLADLQSAARAMAEHGLAPKLLIGHSLGGAAALCAADSIGVRAVATVNAPADVSHVLHQFGEGLAKLEREGEAEVLLAGRPFTVRRQFIDQARGAMLMDAVRQLTAALLVLHSPTDTTVGIDNAATIYAAARHPKSFVSLWGANHLLTGPGDPEYAADLIATWAGRYL